MCHINYIPHKTMQAIALEYLAQSLKSLEQRKVKLTETLMKLPNIHKDQVDEIVREVFEDDKMINSQKELDTNYKRNKYIMENFKYVAPHEIILNQSDVNRGLPKDVIHYIPVCEAFKALVEDPTMINILQTDKEKSGRKVDVIDDVKDGNLYKNIEFFKQNPSAYAAIFYSDVLEIVNPLGSARGKHKVIQVFWTLADIPKAQRSKIDRLQLAMVVKEKLIKKYGYKVIYQNLMKDLKKLEEGIMVNNPTPRLVKCGLLLHAGDNLESHTVGGFSTCFSSRDVCRFCHITYTDLVDHIHDFDGEENHEFWNIAEYDRICDDIERNDDNDGSPHENQTSEPLLEIEGHLFDEHEEPTEDYDDSDDANENDDDEADERRSTYGLRERCPFNSLQSFHAVYGFPPDLLHDLFEGVIAQDLCGIIKILSNQDWFTIVEYNQALQDHPFKYYEVNDKPQPVNPKGMKLPGKAVSLWLHQRCFGMVIQKFVQDYDDDVLCLGMKLSDLTERLTASQFQEYEVDQLEQIILDYLDHRKLIFSDCPALIGRPKPKHHFLGKPS